jgi:DNA-binding response OmpR family regulator
LPRRQVLIVEDSLADVTLIRMAMKKAGISAVIQVVDDGEEAVRLFEKADLDSTVPCPDLVILDLNLPRFKGSEVLRRLRASARCANVPVLVVTSSDSSDDREQMNKLGANGYFRKPSELSEFMKLGQVARGLLKLDSGAAS